MILTLKDGGIRDLSHDTQYNSGGCDTCDYGSYYSTDFYVYLTKGIISVEVETKLSIGFLITLFTQNVELIESMTELEFSDWLKEKFESEYRDSRYHSNIR